MTIAIPVLNKTPRLTFFIKTPSRTISESHWYSIANADLATVSAAGNALAGKRAACLAGGAEMIAMRVSLEKVYKDSLVSTLTLGFTDTGFAPENMGNDALVISCQSGTLYRKVFFLGGIPDDVVANGTLVPSPPAPSTSGAWGKNFRGYLNWLQGGGGPGQAWGFLALQKGDSAPRIPILSMLQNVGPSTLTVTTNGNHMLAAGDVVRISRYPYANINQPFNQLWYVATVPTPSTYTVSGWVTSGTAPITTGAGGWSWKQIRDVVPYTQVQFDSINTRKRGARAFLPLGRVKRKKTVGY